MFLSLEHLRIYFISLKDEEEGHHRAFILRERSEVKWPEVQRVEFRLLYAAHKEERREIKNMRCSLHRRDARPLQRAFFISAQNLTYVV